MGESSSYEGLISRLDLFIRKFYINKAIRGTLLFIAVVLILFLLYSLFESQFYFSKEVRKFFFFSFLLSASGLFVLWIVRPLVSYFKLGKVISHEKAAEILGNHFSDVGDKLLNILQLKKSNDEQQLALIAASINQKSEKIRLVPFGSAIDLSKNKKYLKYALPPLLLMLFVLFAAPSLITDSTYRIINNDKDFEREAPFHFMVERDLLEVIQFEDYRLRVIATGDALPQEALINVDGYEYRMKKVAPNEFEYTFSNVRKNTPFTIRSGDYGTGDYELRMLPKPQLIDYTTLVDYPSYTGQEDEQLTNTGDLIVPEGTQITWRMTTESVDDVTMRFANDNPVITDQKTGSTYQYSRRIMSDIPYTIKVSNEHVPLGDSLTFWIRSVADARPTISVEAIKDTSSDHITYFAGSASDDYGLTRLNLVYKITDDGGNEISTNSRKLDITPSRRMDFDYLMDSQEFDLLPGQQMSYYFEVWDNDRVNGSKSSKTQTLTYRKRSLEELREEEQLNEEAIKDKLNTSIEEASKIQEELQKLREKLLQKETPDWKDKKKLEQLMQRQQQLQQQLQEAQQANEQNLQNQKEMMNMSPELMEKQQRLQELFDEVVNDEMQELMQNIQELMEELNKEQTLQQMEEFKMNEETLQNEMERLSELYKQLEVEKEVNETISELEKLAEEQEKLSEKTENQDATNEELKKEQENIEKELNELEKKMDELMDKNEELEYPKDIPDDAPEQMEDIKEDMQESQENLEKKQNKKAAKQQKDAAEKMKKMASQMQSKMQSGQAQQNTEDIETMRQLLENLVTLSFDQETLVAQVNRTNPSTPKYTQLVQQQMKVKDDFAVAKDTLQALSKRQPNLQTFVLEKVGDINLHLDRSLNHLEQRQTPEANQSQRTTMTHLNDLALMLSESMEQMQKQMSSMMSGSQNCQNPQPNNQGKSGKMPIDKISKGQQKMSEELKKLSENLKNGKGNTAKDFAGAAARQAALRKALQEMQQELQEQGQGGSNELQEIIDEMDKQEIDLVNKRLDNDLLMRQQDILTRLLEAENAQKEREYDDQRQSKEGQDIKRELPPAIQEYINQRKAQLQDYKYISPEMTPYYKRLVEQYYQKLKRA